jgi:hypothetical protein
MWDNLTIKGFHFNSAKEYADAKKESDTIDYICSKMDIRNPEIALKVYIKLLDRQTMSTVLGICFLKQLRDTVLASNMIDEQELKTIHSPSFVPEEDSTEFGDETALLNSETASEYASSVESELPEESDDKPSDAMKRLNRDLSNSLNKEKEARNMIGYLKSKIKKLWLLIAGLAAIIALLFAIAVHNNNLVFVDEEIALQDKYSAWEEDISSREAAVKAREKELGITD